MASRGGGGTRHEDDDHHDDIGDHDFGDVDPRMNRKRTPTGTHRAEVSRRGRVWKYRRDQVLHYLRWGGVVALSLAILGTATVICLFIFYGSDPNLPKIEKVGDYHPRQLVRVVDRDGKSIGEIGAERRTLVPFAQIPKVFLDAVVAAEDPNFYQHQGLDYRGILRALIENALKGRMQQGGSTITQQVVKQLLLTPEKALRRKVQEAILARRISQKLTKNEILEIYVNENNYGHARYGCEEAARYYFNKSIGEVSLAEAAVLAGLPQNPSGLTPRRHPEAAKRRQVYVLDQMARQGYIPQATAEKLAGEPIVLAPEPAARETAAPEAVAAVHRKLHEKYGDRLDTLGATVKTTIDLRMQEQARQSLERGLEEVDQRQGFRGPSGHLTGAALGERLKMLAESHKGGIKDGEIFEGVITRIDRDRSDPRKSKLLIDTGAGVGTVDLALEKRYTAGAKPELVDRLKPGDLVRVRPAPERRRGNAKDLLLALELGPQAAMVVMDPHTHDVLALVGGYGYRPGGYDRTYRAMRQPGSSFKPFLYAAAIESGRYTAASLVNDAPEVYALWKPQNYEKEAFRGPVRLRVALAHSINTIAIRLMADVGLPMVRDFAQRMGITSEIPDSLGLAAALGANAVTPLELANAYATFADEGKRGEPRIVAAIGDEPFPPAVAQPAIRPETAFVVTSMMRSVIDEGTARAAGVRIRRPIAGKTGTTTDLRDAWFVGFSPDLLAAVWVGFDDTRKLGKGEEGARTALPIWIDFMAKALAARPVRDFVQPPGVVTIQIDPASGLRAAPGAEGIAEVFVDGTAPREVAPAAGEEASADKLLLERNQ
jgi:penicillin-binding protein 1A